MRRLRVSTFPQVLDEFKSQGKLAASEAEEGKEMILSLEPPEGMQAY